MMRRLMCWLIGHVPLKRGALWGPCTRCGAFHNTRENWKL